MTRDEDYREQMYLHLAQAEPMAGPRRWGISAVYMEEAEALAAAASNPHCIASSHLFRMAGRAAIMAAIFNAMANGIGRPYAVEMYTDKLCEE